MDRPIQGPLNIGNLRSITTYRAGMLQTAATKALREHCTDILTPYGITKLEWLVIGAALDAGKKGISLKELACQMDISVAKLNSMVNSLQERGKVLSRAGTSLPQRVVLLHPAFAPDCAEIERSLRTALRQSIYGKVSPLEFRIYLKVLYQLSLLDE
jgi:DNA-binding MarR family transcriptional regulator